MLIPLLDRTTMVPLSALLIRTRIVLGRWYDQKRSVVRDPEDTGPVTSRGVVRRWDVERMRGVIDGDDVPGGCLVWFAAVAVDGFPALRQGDHVEFEWHLLDQPNSGYTYECARAWPAGQQPVSRGRRPFRSGLWRMGADGTTEKVTIDPSEQAPPTPKPGGQTTGTVRLWSDEEGWGVIDSDQTPAGAGHTSVTLSPKGSGHWT